MLVNLLTTLNERRATLQLSRTQMNLRDVTERAMAYFGNMVASMPTASTAIVLLRVANNVLETIKAHVSVHDATYLAKRVGDLASEFLAHEWMDKRSISVRIHVCL